MKTDRILYQHSTYTGTNYSQPGPKLTRPQVNPTPKLVNPAQKLFNTAPKLIFREYFIKLNYYVLDDVLLLSVSLLSIMINLLHTLKKRFS
jgi:hypothetical protein